MGGSGADQPGQEHLPAEDQEGPGDRQRHGEEPLASVAEAGSRRERKGGGPVAGPARRQTAKALVVLALDFYVETEEFYREEMREYVDEVTEAELLLKKVDKARAGELDWLKKEAVSERVLTRVSVERGLKPCS